MLPISNRNLRSVASYLRSMWDWTDFNTCFTGTKIRISDIDGMVERKGRFLVIEAKNPSEEEALASGRNRGQLLLFQNLQKKGFTVIVAFGRTTNDVPTERLRSSAEAMIVDLGAPVVERLWLYRPYQATHQVIPEATNETLWNLIAAWFQAANNETLPK